MDKIKDKIKLESKKIGTLSVFKNLPLEVRKWVASIPVNQRLSVLSLLVHVMVATPTGTKDKSLEKQTTDILVSKILKDQAIQLLVTKHLKKFRLDKEINEIALKNYIKQFYIHSVKNLNTQSDIYLEIALKLFCNPEERTIFFNYILGFETLKMMFQMSWFQHERLYQLQKHQEHFLKTYIKPIQKAHRLNGMIVPKYESVFFAKRNYFIRKPEIKEKKLIELLMATFTKETVINLGFLIIHHPNFLVFDYEYIFTPEPEYIFTE